MGAPTQGRIACRAYARVGLLGNPSDGFYGKTIALSLQNFYAEVVLHPSKNITFAAHPVHDCQQFTSLQALAHKIEGEGYYGGIRLLMAICKRFFDYCQAHGIGLDDKNFSLSYDSNIPRQAGLSGSSGIVCAALSCLMQYYTVADRIPVVERPALVLSAEQELGITAGLQDRVIQVYGGLVYMDFDEAYMAQHGHGRYEAMDAALLPPLWLVHSTEPSDSGRVHSDVKRRWLAGDPRLRRTMAEVAALAGQGRDAIRSQNWPLLAELMNRNFDLRRDMFGDEALGALNLLMIETARSVNAAAKFTGSGGAVVVLCLDGEHQERRLQELCRQQGFIVERVVVADACMNGTSFCAVGPHQQLAHVLANGCSDETSGAVLALQHQPIPAVMDRKLGLLSNHKAPMTTGQASRLYVTDLY